MSLSVKAGLTLSYPVAAIETLSRRLADTAFMLRDYKFAASVYDSLRRDYAQDRAWRYAAAATEMYGLSLLLSHTYFQPSSPPTPPPNPFTTLQHTDISSWLEQAVVAYQSRIPPSQIQLDAMRITILYYEAWKAIGEYRGVGAALVRAAGEADEVPSAVFIEEAAAADVKLGKGRGKRRRALHLVTAAGRYETAGLVSSLPMQLRDCDQSANGSAEIIFKAMSGSSFSDISRRTLDSCSGSDRILSWKTSLYFGRKRCCCPALFETSRKERHESSRRRVGRYGIGL